MPDSKQLVSFCWLVLALCFSMSATAAQTVFVTDLSVIPVGAAMVAVGIALTGGLAATLAKISNPAVKTPNIWLTVLADTTLSLVAGLAAFFACAAYGLDPFKAALAILISGFAPARILEKFISAGISQISQRTGTTDPAP
jgi:hypothetical protein